MKKVAILCIINVYIPYTYKNDSIYGSVMNILQPRPSAMATSSSNSSVEIRPQLLSKA